MNLLWFNLRTDTNYPGLAFGIDWINAVADYAKRIDVVTMLAGDCDVRSNVQVFSIGKEKGYSKVHRALEFYRVLGRLLSKGHYDACFAHMQPLFAVLGTPLLKIKRIPVTLWYAHKSVNWRLRLAEKLVDRIVTASPESFRIPSRKVIVTGHGIDTTRFVPAPVPRGPDRPFTVTSVGRLSPVKRLETLIEATDLLVHHYGLMNVRVRLVGSAYDVAYAERLRREVAARGLKEIVDFVGTVPHTHVLAEYQQADAFVNLSDTDSIDKAVLEAMSCEVPVVTSNAAFERVLGDVNAATPLLVPKGDATALAQGLLALTGQRVEERRELGRQLRRIVIEGHSLQRLARRLAEEILLGRSSCVLAQTREPRSNRGDQDIRKV